jgi:hypothetical protein
MSFPNYNIGALTTATFLFVKSVKQATYSYFLYFIVLWCYCIESLGWYNKKNKDSIQYPNLPSAMRPVHHGPDVPTPTPPTTLPESETSSPSGAADDNDVNFPSAEEDKIIIEHWFSELGFGRGASEHEP